MAKAKKITTEHLAGMVGRGFNDMGQKIDKGFETMDRGFAANERNFSELGQVLQAILKQVNRLGDVKTLEERVERLEKKTGIR